VVTVLDPKARTLTVRLDGADPREVVLPRSYLDGRARGERNRRLDLAYATTGHRAQGLTRGRALVRLTGREDVNWLYVQLSRARQDTRLYAVVGPEPHGAEELDLPDRDQPNGYLQLAQALARAGGQTLAIDTPSSLDLRRLSTAELRAERDRLRRLLDQAPGIAAGSWPGPPPTASKPRKPWPPTSRPAADHRAACFASCGAATTSRPSCRVGWRWPPNRPTGPMTGSGSCASTSSAATAGWKPTPPSAPSIDKSCRPWPGSDAPPDSPSSKSAPAMSWRCWGRCPGRPGAGGPGARPPPRSRTTGAATRSRTRTGPSALRPTTQASGLTGSGPARPSTGFTPSSAPPTAPSSASRPANTPANRDLGSSAVGQVPSGPPASTSRKEHPDGQLSTLALGRRR
jgi:hypothetical protein